MISDEDFEAKFLEMLDKQQETLRDLFSDILDQTV